MNFLIQVQYKGTDDVLTISPVFDMTTMHIPEQGLSGFATIKIATFFLVYENVKGKKLWWIKKEDCEIIETSCFGKNFPPV